MNESIPIKAITSSVSQKSLKAPNMAEGRNAISETLPASIFDEHWWFDAACPNAWDIREIRRDNRLVASFAFHYFKKLGFRYINMPRPTRTLTPHIFPQGAKPVSRLQNQVSILSELLAALPSYDRFELCLPPETDLVLPFTMCGFTNTATYTFRFIEGRDALADMEQKTRNIVLAAQKRFQIEKHTDIDRYIRLSMRAHKGDGEADKSDYPAIARLLEACIKRDRAVILSAVNEAQNDVASAALIWDDRVLYYWMSARETSSSGNGANSLLIWKAHELARVMNRTFDLDGFRTPQSGMFLAKFGFAPVVRPYISNVNPVWNGLFGLKEMISSATGVSSAEIAYR